MNELPPAYTIAIEDTRGFVNPSFMTDADAAQTSGASDSDINTRNAINDNTTLHI